ncbi:MAG: cobalt-precorrin-5B (C(1))-methyltransferase, partial [Thermosynechococcaceae cyanobacterium]
STAEAGLQYLRSLDEASAEQWVNSIYGQMTHRIDQRATDYIGVHCGHQNVQVGSALFDRSRQIFAISKVGHPLLQQWPQS